MICLSCGHYSHPDAEMARVQQSDDCPCACHKTTAAMPPRIVEVRELRRMWHGTPPPGLDPGEL